VIERAIVAQQPTKEKKSISTATEAVLLGCKLILAFFPVRILISRVLFVFLLNHLFC